MKILDTFLIPFVITLIPLVMVVGLSFVKRIRASFSATVAATSLSVFFGLFTPFLAVIHCAGILASLIPVDQPKCVIGAVTFLPIGGLFTLISLLAGIYLVIVTYLQHRKPRVN